MYLYADDLFIFICVFGFGYLGGIGTVVCLIAYNLICGNTITFRKED